MNYLRLGILVVNLRPLKGFGLNPFLSSHLKRMKNHFLAAIRGLCGGLLIDSMTADCPIAQGLPSIHPIAAFEWSIDALAFAKPCFGHFGFEARSDHCARQQATRPATLALVDPGIRPCQDGRIWELQYYAPPEPIHPFHELS